LFRVLVLELEINSIDFMKESEREILRGKIKEREMHRIGNMRIREIILGGQDGLVNVLGIILAVASATKDTKIVIISGLAGLFAESISMLAVNYTSSKATGEVYRSELKKEKEEIEEVPELERQEIWDIFYERGLRGSILEKVVDRITSDKKLWLDVMMKDELRLFPTGENALGESIIVGIAAVVGSLIPLIPFLILPVSSAILWSVIFSAIVLFVGGAIKAKIIIGNWFRSGLEMALIGMIAAILGYAIGALVGAVV
jgi:VIT1/CCC1 family predicted Fe2+/Mn2+ transporter